MIAKIRKIKKQCDILEEQDADTDDSELPDPDKGLGSALRDNRQISFQKLPFIVHNYQVVFGKRVKDVFCDTSGGYIAALAAVRNLLIHKAGVVDSQFAPKVTTFPELSTAKPNERLKLDGEIVNKLRDAATTVGTSLIAYVDAFLARPNDAGVGS